jgi:hypothetical protein
MPDRADLPQRVRQLDLVVDSMRTAFNRNHRAYSEALSAVDGHLAVLRAVINDLVRNEVTVIKEGESTGSVDWDTYYGWYNDFIKRQAAADAAAKEGAAPVVESLPTSEELFGGDHGSRDRSVSEGIADAGVEARP